METWGHRNSIKYTYECEISNLGGKVVIRNLRKQTYLSLAFPIQSVSKCNQSLMIFQ